MYLHIESQCWSLESLGASLRNTDLISAYQGRWIYTYCNISDVCSQTFGIYSQIDLLIGFIYSHFSKEFVIGQFDTIPLNIPPLIENCSIGSMRNWNTFYSLVFQPPLSGQNFEWIEGTYTTLDFIFSLLDYRFIVQIDLFISYTVVKHILCLRLSAGCYGRRWGTGRGWVPRWTWS